MICLTLGINGQIIDKSLRGDDSPKFRRVFLHNLAMALMNAHLATRSSLSSLPVDVKSLLQKRDPTLRQSTSKEVTPKKRHGTCNSCGRGKNTSTSKTCDRCGQFTCTMHATVTTLCNTCTNDTTSDSD